MKLEYANITDYSDIKIEEGTHSLRHYQQTKLFYGILEMIIRDMMIVYFYT